MREAGADGAQAAHLARRRDLHGGMVRVECFERGSGAHFGHDMEDGKLCINAASLVFVPAGTAPPSWLPAPTAPAVAAALRAAPVRYGTVRVATLAAGCFWSVRRALAATPGVLHEFLGGPTRSAPGPR